MNIEKQWDIILKNNLYPCLISNADTYDVIYANNEFVKLVGESKKIVGRKFYEVIENDNAIDLNDIRLKWDSQNIVERQLDNHKLNISFHVTFTLIKNENIIFCLLTPTDESKVVISNFEKAMSQCVEIFSKPKDTALLSFMELLSNFYEAERAYTYRFNYENNTINCVSQWCDNPDFLVTEEVSTKMDATVLLNWIQTQNDTGIIVADAQHPNFDHNSVTAKILDTFKMKNFTFCTIEDDAKNVVGVVGLSNRKHMSDGFDTRLISTISKFVSQDINKQIADATLFKVHYLDTLTGLYNRIGYARLMEKMKSEKPSKLGVISANINGLKNINHTLGNEQGDFHIKECAKIIKEHFGYECFRISGDEIIAFAIEVEKEDFENKVFSLHKKMKDTNNFDFSFGHSFGENKFILADLIREADASMYINKQEYYSSGKINIGNVSNVILRDLLSFLENDEFMVYLQPQLNLKNGSLHGAEALIRRFDKRNQKMVFPDQFISLYEQNGVIRHIDLFVLESVCKLLAEWIKNGKEIPISVNLSRVTLQEYNIVKTIADVCDKYNVPHNLVVIEVTERIGLTENNVASSLIIDFQNQGFAISLDDFGCAYSNIVTLAQIEVDEVKIDKSLIDEATSNRKNYILIKNVIAMCDELDGMATLAEGIEEASQVDILNQLGCKLGQGYFYSRPIPVQDFYKKYIL